MASYLLLGNGTDRLLLADGSSFLLLNEGVAQPAIPGRSIIWREPAAVIWREPAVIIWREP